MAEKTGAGGRPQEYNKENGRYGSSGAGNVSSNEEYQKQVNARIKWANENGIKLPFNEDGSLNDIKLQELYSEERKSTTGPELSQQEFAVLRQEVIRKNADQKGKVIPTNCAFTANHFYVYTTTGDDEFTPIIKLSLEDDRELINAILQKFKR